MTPKWCLPEAGFSLADLGQVSLSLGRDRPERRDRGSPGGRAPVRVGQRWRELLLGGRAFPVWRRRRR